MTLERIPVLNAEDGTMYGFVAKQANGWVALLRFGYPIARTATRDEAENVLRNESGVILNGVWQYYDKDDKDWFPCILKKIQDHKVTVARVNDMGYTDVMDDKRVELIHPDETVLIKP